MDPFSLRELGWSSHFQSQLQDSDHDLTPARVRAVHRDALEVMAESFDGRVRPFADEGTGEVATVGDWVLVDVDRRAPKRLLQRRSLFKRKGAGSGRNVQLIAANVDTLFIVTSANLDFNVARLERYLALAAQAEVDPVILITKADLVEDARPFEEQARRIMSGVLVESINACDPASLGCLAPWLKVGQTIALVGSSGVGKSTIVNSLSGVGTQATQGIREDDARGRHTTTGRSLHRLENGAWLMDTPGMRELQIVDAADGVEEVFGDIVELASRCRFSDCTHEEEPGCAVRAAIADGALEEDRLKRYRKLQREDRWNSETTAEAHERSRRFGRMARQVFAHKLKNREW